MCDFFHNYNSLMFKNFTGLLVKTNSNILRKIKIFDEATNFKGEMSRL